MEYSDKMKNTMSRLLIVMMSVLFCLSAFISPLRADDLLGETDTINVTVLFDVNTTGELANLTFEYKDSFFRKSAENYNHSLARLSFGMALSAFRPNFDPNSRDDPSRHLTQFLDTCHFLDLRTDDYDKNPSLYTVSTVMGHKQIVDEEGEFTLIAVGVCGGGYTNEWLSNFSCGDDEMHLGFYSAASEVYDRLFGYIAKCGLTGQRFKVWVAGFSRAAAVSNIFSKLLVDTDVFDTTSVYAYTFATPRTTKNPEAGKYPNIYNICGKMDPVPNLAFADWGYDRYGTTLYTPAQQTDSDYNVKVARANRIHKQAFGLDFFNNVEWDTKLRVILNYLLKIAPTSKIYYEHLQERVIKMWQNKSLSNIMSCLMEIAGDKELINDSNQKEANSMLTYIAYTIYGYLTSSDVDAKYRSTDATTVGNLAREHTPEVYLSWLFSNDNPDDIYTDSLDYLRIVISGDVDVAIMVLGNYELYKCLKSDGTFTDEFVWENTVVRKKDPNAPDVFMERVNGEHIILLPKDMDYSIMIRSNIDQRVEMHAIPLKVGYTNNEFNRVHYAEMKAGDYETMYSGKGDQNSEYFDLSAGDSFEEVNIDINDSSELAIDLERANIFNLSWRQIVIFAFTLPLLAINILGFLIAWATGSHRISRKKKLGLVSEKTRYNVLPAALTFIALALFMIQELIYWLMPQYMMTRAMLKLGIGVALLYHAYLGYRKQPSRLSRDVFIALFVCMVGDMTINFSFAGGVVIFGAAMAILAYCFTVYDKPEKWQYVLWGVLSFIAVVIIYLSKGINAETKSQMVVYSVILMALISASMTMPKKIRAASILLAVSNVLLFVDEVYTRTLMVHVRSLAIYYLAMGLFAYSTRYREVSREDRDRAIRERYYEKHAH